MYEIKLNDKSVRRELGGWEENVKNRREKLEKENLGYKI